MIKPPLHRGGFILYILFLLYLLYINYFIRKTKNSQLKFHRKILPHSVISR